MDPDLLDLIAAYKGQVLEPARREALMARLRGDEAFLQAFVDEVVMLGMLKAVQSTEPRWLLLVDELGWSEEGRPRVDLAGRLAAGLRGTLPRRLTRRRLGRIAALAAVALASAGLTLLIRPGARPEPSALSVAPPRTASATPILALMIKLDGAIWEPEAGPPVQEGETVPARRLSLRAGRATLSLLNGVILTMEGPADLELIALDRVYCRRGRYRARVPHGAEGFVASAPGAAVVDLGTEFALNVEDDGKARMMVFQGTAEAAVLGAEGSAERSRLVDSIQAFDIDPSRNDIRAAEASAGRFVAPPLLVAPGLALEPAYPEAVLRSRPWGYWRFESMSEGTTPNEVAGKPALRALGPVTVSGAGRGNGCAVFGDGEDIRYLMMDGVWQPPKSSGFAIEIWAQPHKFDHATLVALRVVNGREMVGHFSLLEMTGVGQHPLWKPDSVRLLYRWPPGAGGGVNVFSNRIYRPYRWQHLVAQKNGDRIELYVDGALNSSVFLGDEQGTGPCQVMLGQMTTGNQSRPFFGRLDELAVYDRPLEASEVLDHYRLAGRGPRDPK
jgi:hypothetical protein